MMKHKTIKARKQGTSITLTIPVDSPVTSPADIEHDRRLIEQSFTDDQLLTPTDMKKRFEKYGW